MVRRWGNANYHSTILDCFEEEEAVLSDIKINVVLGLVGHVWAEVTAYEGMPVSIVLAIQFILQMGGNLLDCVHLLQRVFGDH